MSHNWMSHVINPNESCHLNKSVISCLCMRHVTHMHNRCVHSCRSHGTSWSMNQFRHKCERVCHTDERIVCYERVMSTGGRATSNQDDDGSARSVSWCHVEVCVVTALCRRRYDTESHGTRERARERSNQCTEWIHSHTRVHRQTYTHTQQYTHAHALSYTDLLEDSRHH